MIVVFVVVGVVLIVGMLASCVSVTQRRRSLERAASASVEFEGKLTPLDRVAWAVASAVGVERVANQLVRADPKTANQAADSLRAVTLFLTEEERGAAAHRLATAERAWAERAFWDLQTESIQYAAGIGMIDALIIAAGGQANWAVDQIESALEPVDVSRTLIEHALNNKYDHYIGYFNQTLFEHATNAIDDVAGNAIDVGVNVVLDGTGHAVAAIADAHIPVVTIIRSIHRAKKSTDAGLDPARVRENLVLDVGFKGGGIAGGATAGALIGGVVPVVGHVVGALVGGVVGGFLGGGVAEGKKTRHLRLAMQRSQLLTDALGNSIGPVRWTKVAAAMRRLGQQLSGTVEQLDVAADAARRGLVPPLAHYILVAAARVGSAEAETAAREYDDWLAELRASSGSDCATFRGRFALTRPDLHEVLDVDEKQVADAISAVHEVQQEREKLALAQG